MSAVLLQIVTQVSNEAMLSVQPESGAAQTGPRVSESASSDGGCGPRAGESCVGGGETGCMVVAGLGGSSSEVEEDPTPKRRRLHRGNQITTDDADEEEGD